MTTIRVTEFWEIEKLWTVATLKTMTKLVNVNCVEIYLQMPKNLKTSHGNVTHVIVEFDITETGTALRENQTSSFRNKYPSGTPISKLKFQYKCQFFR